MKYLLLALPLFLISLSACSSNEKNDNMGTALQSFLGHVEKQEYLKAISYATASSADILEDQQRTKPQFKVKSCQNKSEKEGFCVIEVCYEIDGGKECANDTFQLKYEAKSWRVDWLQKVEAQMFRSEEALEEQLEQIKKLKELQLQLNNPEELDNSEEK